MSGDETPVTTDSETPTLDQSGAGTPVPTSDAKRGGGRWWWVVGIAIAVLVVVLLSPLASPEPDGLERVAEDNGFIDQATNLVGGLLGDYAIPGVGNEAVSTVLSGLLGIAIVVGLLFLLGRLMARRRA